MILDTLIGVERIGRMQINAIRSLAYQEWILIAQTDRNALLSLLVGQPRLHQPGRLRQLAQHSHLLILHLLQFLD